MRSLALLAVPAIILVLAPVAPAKRAAAPNPIQRAFQAEVVVVGKVSAIEKETVEAAESPGAAKIAHTIAVVKVDESISGAANLTHVKVGFVPADPNAPRRGGPAALAVNQEALFFLSKHPSGQFYAFNWMSSPVDATAENYKATIASVKKAFEVVSDPAKALKAEKPDARAFAASVLVIKNRTVPNGGEVGIEKMSVEESHRILAAFAESDWAKYDPILPAPASVFYMLGLTAEDGWAAPKPQPGADFNAELHKAFAKWVEGAGKEYRMNKMVVKVK